VTAPIFELPDEGGIHDLENGGPIRVEPGDSCVHIEWPDECGEYSHLIVELQHARKLARELVVAIYHSDRGELEHLEELWESE
jgi:hypothetical protein